jgi:endonuclease YncB( thermonuclease family)
MRCRIALVSILLIVLLLQLSDILFVKGYVGEIDKTAKVDWVTDGDTFNITSGETIRLADVNAPEYNEPGFSEAKEFMINLLHGKTVYLDIDNKTTYDPYGRLVCVVYVDYNATHYENVNKALLEFGYAEEWDHTNNDFSPSTWNLFVPKNTIPEFPESSLLVTLLLATLVTSVVFKASKKRIN